MNSEPALTLQFVNIHGLYSSNATLLRMLSIPSPAVTSNVSDD